MNPNKMGHGKKDLEIVYNLQWKNVSGNGDDKANIVGMYDIPATTLNWETFKSYLLKNSGATGDDVKVSYVSIDDKEFPIESQLDFQIALYSFRQRARNGDIITLKLDRISDQGRMGRMKRLRRSAEPRVEEEKVQVACIASENSAVMQNDGPPDWFKKYMKGFKKEIVEEVTSSVINHVSSTMKTQSSSQFPCHHSRKSKVECCKRPRKVPLALNKPDANDKELVKSLKLERKLDSKLEKLEQKTMKIKEKKLCLIRSNDDDISGRNSSKSRPIGMPLSDTEVLMDASAVGHHELTVPHMSGGETYQQEWEVVNTGDMQWNENTELRYAWGSEALKPVERIVPCPKLKPGEKGTVVVYLEIPRKAGNYECYWHFYHEGRRFGHWLGCQVIVDPSPVKLQNPLLELLLDNTEKEILTSPVKLESHPLKEFILEKNTENEVLTKSLNTPNQSCTSKKLKTDEDLKFDLLSVNEDLKFRLMNLPDVTNKPLNTSVKLLEEKDTDGDIHILSGELQGIKINYDAIAIHDSNSSSDCDNQSIISIADSNSSMHSAPGDEFVVVPMPERVDVDEKINEEKEVSSGNLCISLNSNIKLEKIDNVKLENSVVANDMNMGEVVSFKTTEKESEINEIKNASLVVEVDNDESQFGNKNECAYAYVVVNEQKIAVPKYLLRADYLATAEDAPAPVMVTSSASIGTPISIISHEEERNQEVTSSLDGTINADSENTQQTQRNTSTPINPPLEQAIQDSKITESFYVSSEGDSRILVDDSSNQANNPNKSRLFVFPLNCPGFEVVYPPNSFVESLPPELESMESSQNTKVEGDYTQPEYPYEVFFVNPTKSPHYENVAMENPYVYAWSKSHSAYAYSPADAPPQAGFKQGPNAQQAQSASGTNRSFHEAFTNESGTSNTLHHRFGSYMRHRPAFNHAKHCSGMHCRQPFYKSATATSSKSTGPAETADTFSQYSANSGNNYQRAYNVYMPRKQMPQTPPHTTASNEGQSNTPPNGNGSTSSTMHILPDTLVSGAVNVASSAINTARSVLNMFSPPPRQDQGQWESGHWTTNDPESPRERALRVLSEMGFWDRNLNATLLARYNDDLARVISELVQ